MSDLDQAQQRLLALHEAAQPSDGGDAVATLRREARAAFAEQGLPTTRMEEWRYTNLAPLARLDLAEPAQEPVDCPPPDVPAHVQFANGVRSEGAAALPAGVSIDGLGDGADLGQLAPAKEHPFVALNTAFLLDAARVRVEAGAQVDEPVRLDFATVGEVPRLCQPRVLLQAAPRSRATVVIDLRSATEQGGFLRNAVIETHVEDDAELRVVLLERSHPEDVVVTHFASRQGRNARLETHTVTLGGRLVRNDLSAVLAGEGAECRLLGLFLAAGDDVIDNHTLVDHAVPHGRSDELYKGVLAENGRGVFRGRVLVRPDAQKTDASQSNPNLLLHDGAEIDTKPQLEIHADDVRCSHGSAIGRLDPEALYYLRARGIDEPDARRLLTEGFAAEILAGLPVADLGESLGEHLRERLGALGS